MHQTTQWKKASKAMHAGAPGKKKRKKKAKDNDDIPSVSESGFDEPQFPGVGGPGLDPTGNPNQDEMMAASALRGVRGGPNLSGGAQFVGSTGLGIDGGAAQQQLQQAGGGYGSFFGGMNSINPYGSGVGGAAAPTGAYSQDMGNSNDRAFLGMGFPYQQYGGYPLGNSQAVLMAQALRGAPNPYHNQFLGLSGEYLSSYW